MITIRIPEDIRKYREKIAFGLTARQLISIVITTCICVPLYFIGNQYLSKDIVSWAIIIIALPVLSTGFLFKNGLPMEKYAAEILRYELLYPVIRRYISTNAFRHIQDMAIKEGMPKGWRRMKIEKYNMAASLERTVLLEEALQRSEADFNADSAALITVRKPKLLSDNARQNKGRRKDTVLKKPPLQAKVEAIEQKLTDNPEYIMTWIERRWVTQWKISQINRRKKEINSKKKTVLTNSKKLTKRKSAKSAIPRSTQDTIHYIADYDEGMFETTQHKYSKLYRLKDVNYNKSKYEEREGIFILLGQFYNYFSDSVTFSVTLDNRYVSLSEQEDRIFTGLKNDEYDIHRIEYNKVLRHQLLLGRNDMKMDKLFTLTVDADNPYEALLRFRKMDNEIRDYLRKFGSDAIPLSTTERLAYYHDKFRRGHEGEFKVDYNYLKKQGLCSKDYIAPSYFYFNKNYFQIDDDYYRVMFMTNLPVSITDEFFCNFCDNDFATTTTISVQPMAQDKALRFVKKRLTGIEMNKMDAEKSLAKQGLSPDHVRHDIADSYERGKMLYDDVLNKDQRLFFATITVMIHGTSLEELDYNCKILEGKAGTVTAQLRTLTMQQEEAFKVTMPFGHYPKHIKADTTLTTESLAVFMPFKNQELFQAGGFYYGLNQLSHNLIVLDRNSMKTPSGFVLGTSGSGKSFATKREIMNVLLTTDTDMLIIDPENEYADFCRAFGGEVIKISADSSNFINPMDMDEDYGLDEEDDSALPMPVKIEKAWRKKSDFILSIIERMISVGGNVDKSSITAQQRTIVDRCVKQCYQSFFEHNFDPEYVPTLKDLQNELDKEREKSKDGRLIAEGVEYYTRGSMSFLANKTNVQINKRMVVFNVRDLGDQLRQIALSIVFDFIWNRMVSNKNRGVRTYCYCDEIHVMFRSYYTAYFFQQLYKRGRKYGLCITGLTQNVSDLLSSDLARGMIGNSDYIMMLNQHSEDLKLLSAMLGISESQMPYVVGADVGSGLLFAESTIVPFIDRFPTDSYLYKLMSTKFGEDLSSDEVDKRLKAIINPGMLN